MKRVKSGERIIGQDTALSRLQHRFKPGAAHQHETLRQHGRKARETRQDGTGKTEGAKASAEHCGSHCEAEAGNEGKDERKLQTKRFVKLREWRPRG